MAEPVAPLNACAFAAAMTALGPFEARPALAVAVSGGADSTALCLLAKDWADARGGSVLALIVDHGLRPGSGEEARRTAARLFALGITSEILAWAGEKPTSAIQAKARQARHRLLADRCRERGLLHLLVGHHRDDQVETLLLRAASGSGGAGLAGMSPLVETGAVRVLRPLLAVPKQRLTAWLAERGVDWTEDPSNADPAFARARLRAARVGTDAARVALAEAAPRHRERRARQEEAVAALLARHCRLDPLGFAVLDGALLAAADADADAVEVALGRVAAAVGGTPYPPADAKLAGLRCHLGGSSPASLGRCCWRWLPRGEGGGSGRGRILVFREIRGLPGPAAVRPGETAVPWDGRFLVGVGAGFAPFAGDLLLAALGARGWREARRLWPGLHRRDAPYPCALSLPALRDDLGLIAVPGLGLFREPVHAKVAVRFRPLRSLSGSGYYLA